MLWSGDSQPGEGDPFAIPVALVNDNHFWGVKDLSDSGEREVFGVGLGSQALRRQQVIGNAWTENC